MTVAALPQKQKNIDTVSEIVPLGEFMVGSHATIEEMVCAGEYYHADKDISSATISIELRGPRKLSLVRFKTDMSLGKIEAAVRRMGHKELGTNVELLAVGKHPKHKELQWEFPMIIALGHPTARDFRNLRLYRWRKERSLYLTPPCTEMYSHSWILLADNNTHESA